MHLALRVAVVILGGVGGAIGIFLAMIVVALVVPRGVAWLLFDGLPLAFDLIFAPILDALRRLRRMDIRGAAWAHWARWRTRAGVRGMLGRFCWRRLVRLGWLGYPRRWWRYKARDRAWLLWCQAPDDDGWTYLSQRYPIKKTADLFAAASAVYPGGGDRAALVAFCGRHRLVPEDPVQRAQFYALTGQGEQRRALDPDGALIAAAYRVARAETRAALRESLDDPADLDAVGAMARAGISSAHAERTPDQEAEIRHLTGQLARHRDWAGLWRLVRDMPLLDAVETMRLMDTGWRPDARHEHELFALLASADPARLTIAANSMSTARGLKRLSALVDRPQDSWRRADLGTALRASQRAAVVKAVGPLHELLLGCLEYRFGADVALGVTAVGDDDIAIAGSADPILGGERAGGEP
jgi:hypothetical protein